MEGFSSISDEKNSVLNLGALFILLKITEKDLIWFLWGSHSSVFSFCQEGRESKSSPDVVTVVTVDVVTSPRRGEGEALISFVHF